MKKEEAIEEVLLACRELVDRGLVARTWGNVSCRIDDHRFVITPSGIDYGRLTPETIVEVDGRTLTYQGKVKPSSEKGIHAEAYRLNPHSRFVIHSHQTYASCLSLAGFHMLDPRPEEKDALGGAIERADYSLPGSKSLRKKVADKLTTSSAILMERHGALLAGEDREMAFDRALILEEVCRRAVGNLAIGEVSHLVISRSQPGTGGLGLNKESLPSLPLHEALHELATGPRVLLQGQSPLLTALMGQVRSLPALLDDFAQIIGSDVKVVEDGDRRALIKASRGRNAVLVQGQGAFCFSGTESDAQAIFTLLEKNALCYLNAARYGKVKPLSYLDRKLMRLVYTRKYAKMK